MAATKLSQYRAALRHLGDIRLATITDDVEARYALDDSWDAATAFVLRQAPWRFALKHAGLAVSGTRVDGYATSYGYPSDWLRTHAVYQVSNGRECPFDFREVGSSSLSVNVSGDVEMRYVSSDYVNPELVGHPWPEHFSAVHAAYLAFSVAYRVTGDPQAETRMSQLFASLLPEAASIDAIPEDPWLPFQRNGAFLRVIQAVAGEDFWRFALKTVPISVTSGAAEGGFTKRFATPSDWLVTRSLYRLTTDTAYVQSDQRRPFDVREHAGAWHTNAADFYAEYVSSAQAFDSTLWPDLYTTAVLRRLEFEAANLSGDKDALQSAGAAWKDAFATARKSEASPPDPWFDYQISGALQRCIPSIISKGYWRFAFKRLLLNAETDQDAAPTDGAYPYRFTLPGDWLKTHAMFIPYDGGEMPFDVREEQGYWRTSTVSFMVRYVSTAALDPLQWPDSLAKAVQAYLDFETAPADAQKNAAEVWAEAISAALAEYGVPEHTWLRFQLDGRYIEAVKHLLGTARWRFAIKTRLLTADATQASDGTISGTLVPNAFGDGSISPSYSAVFQKPGDWYRTIWMYRVITGGPQVNVGRVVREDLDYRDEAGNWHTNWDTIQVRYLSRDGLDSTRCPASFRNAVLAWLEYEEARHDPKLAGVAAGKLSLFKDLQQAAEEEDDTREMPQTDQVGRFVRSRYRNGSYTSSGAGGTAVSTETILTDDSGTTILTP
jgi:hypothetical protein